jgi:hypothetical protein
MKKLIASTTMIVSLFLLALISCKKDKTAASIQADTKTTFDNPLVKTFFTENPLIKKHQTDVEQLYRTHEYLYV